MSNANEQQFSAICVDMGTTNTRVWLRRGTVTLAKLQASVGVRDTARDNSPQRIRAALAELIAELRRAHDPAPACVIAAGMITSPLGLAEVPHLSAPAGLRELIGAVEQFSFPDICDLPFLLVPGVRCGAVDGPPEEVGQRDVMRGEETLCAGLLIGGRLTPPATILNLGSHWKAIALDGDGRVAQSITSLSGELIHATQTNTILAGSVPAERPLVIDETWCAAGMREQRRAGLARALFCVRLLELSGQGTPSERMSFLIGAFIAADLDALRARGVFATGQPVFITGSGAVAAGWQYALSEHGTSAIILSGDEIEEATLTALMLIARESLAAEQAAV
jgi:2-dehydro-3-deoxygalactonokinase